ncbi:MAG: GatB/YqeY domain-containing protein [Deltaproteobacteria bacterium]|nr:GatB/YqeY domain-containing protein [Deltaproteobacteria bacterium]
MSTLQEQITSDWKDAMKARDPKKAILASIRTELKNAAINGRAAGDQSTDVEDEAALEVLGKMAKQRRESIAEFKKGDREDLAEKESFELAAIQAYLPAALSDDELGAIVDEAVASTGASSMKDMGKLMAALMPKVKGRADGGRVQTMVKTKLG